MKILYYVCLLCLPCMTSAQSGLTDSTFNFWIGHWDVSWDEEGGKLGTGTNFIESTLDNKVIRENFRINSGKSLGFKGTSISVFNPKTETWKQAWADNQGVYFDFTGELDGDKKIFKTAILERNGKSFISRMVFKDISYDKFTWDWERSEDNGKTWSLNWRIQYKRRNDEGIQTDLAISEKGAPNPSAPSQLLDFSPMIGTCDCTSQRLQQDGSWQDPESLVWTFKYIMNGMGIQDEFALASGRRGGSIRQFNVDSSKWYVHYYASDQPTAKLQSWEGEKTKDDQLVLYSPQASTSGEAGFLKLTFFDLSENGYNWKGEWVNTDESTIVPFWKINCVRN